MKDEKSKGQENDASAKTDDVMWAFTEMVDVSKFFRTYCYRSVVEQGFSLNEIDVLISLKQHPERNTVKGISETMHLSKGIISQAVESLRKKKMITVNQSEQDRRSVLIHLSQMSQPVLEKLKESSSNFIQLIISGVSHEQLHEITKVVTQFCKNKETMKTSDPISETENSTGGAAAGGNES